LGLTRTRYADGSEITAEQRPARLFSGKGTAEERWRKLGYVAKGEEARSGTEKERIRAERRTGEG